MKRFILCLFGIFICLGAIAETITINWGKDNQTYATTTCEIGGNVTLPNAPTKRGHVFRGWIAEHFNRGTFANFSYVPTNVNLYAESFSGNHTPLKNDYIIVSNASDYNNDDIAELIVNSTDWGSSKPAIDITVINTGTNNYVYLHLPATKETATQIFNTKYYIYRVAGGYALFNSTDSFSVGEQAYQPGEEFRWLYSARKENLEVKQHVDRFGAWKFIYDGVWNTDGKNGWKPFEQIVNE